MKRATTIIVLLSTVLLTAFAAGCGGSGAASAGSASAAASGAASAASEATSEGATSSEAAPPDDNPIFDTTRVHTIEVTLSENDRADQLANPKEKTKYTADVVIDGETLQGVSFQTKGNSSLYFTADAGRDKFSYAIKFGSRADGRTFHGLRKLNLQNNFVDATLMREYLSYWLFRRMGVDAPLGSYVWLTVNGEDQGLYLALEDVDDSFLARTAAGAGTIYKPEAEGMALTDDEMDRLKDGNSAAHESGGGADLAYRDDNEESYPDIFDNAETDEAEGTHERVIASLKALSENKDLEGHLDTGEIVRYFAVHNYLVNYDSYTGVMLHNYCLYEADGKLAMLPWDYDNAFGSFPADAVVGASIDSDAVINAGIDSPLGGVADEARPMWNWILSDETWLTEYHDALSELVGILESGEFEDEASRVYELILPYMEKDPKSLYTPDEFKKAYEAMVEISKLRAESVSKQLSGQLATKADLQAEADKVDATAVSISDMGSMEKLYEAAGA